MANDVAKEEVYPEEFSERNKAPYETLLKEFQETRQQLAEARVHIDKLRFGANFTIDHCFELLFKHQFASPQSAAGSTCSLPKLAWTNSCQEGGGISAVDVLNALHGTSKQPAVSTAGMEDASTSPLPHDGALNHIRELRDQVNAVAGSINDSNAPPEELCSQLTALQQEHQKMVKDIGSFVHEGEDEMKALLQGELTGFAEQLRELNNLLREKAQEISVDNDKVQHSSVVNLTHDISERALPQCYFIESGGRGGYRSSSLASQSIESFSHCETSPSPLPSSPSISIPPPPPPSSRMADKDRIAQVQRRLSMQTRAFTLTSPQPVLSSSSSSSMSSSLVTGRSRERPKRKKRSNLPLQSEAHPDPSLLNWSDINSKHKGNINHKSRIPLRLRDSPTRPSHYLPYPANQAPLWQDSVIVDSGFGGSPYGHMNHWQGTSPCNTSVHSSSAEEQDDRLYSNNSAMPKAMERDEQQLSNSADGDSSHQQQQQQLLHDPHLSRTGASLETSKDGDTSFQPFHDRHTSTPINPLHVSHHPFHHATPSTCDLEQFPNSHSTRSYPMKNLPLTANSFTNTSTPASIPALQLHSQSHPLSYLTAHISTTQQPLHTVQSVGTQPSLLHPSGYSSSDQVAIPPSSNGRSTHTAAHGHQSSRIPVFSRNGQFQTPSSHQYISPSQGNSKPQPSPDDYNINSDPQTSSIAPATITGHHRTSRIPLPKYANRSCSPSPSKFINTSAQSPSRPVNTASPSSRPINTTPRPSFQPINTSPSQPISTSLSQPINTESQFSSSPITRSQIPIPNQRRDRSPYSPTRSTPSPSWPISVMPSHTLPTQSIDASPFNPLPSSRPITTSHIPISNQRRNRSSYSPSPTRSSPSPFQPVNVTPARSINASRIPISNQRRDRSPSPTRSTPSPSRPNNTLPTQSIDASSFNPLPSSRPITTSHIPISNQRRNRSSYSPSPTRSSPSSSRQINASQIPVSSQRKGRISYSPSPTRSSPSPSRPINASQIPVSNRRKERTSYSPSPTRSSRPINASQIPVSNQRRNRSSYSPSPTRSSPSPSRPINASQIPISNQRRNRSSYSPSLTRSNPFEDRCTNHPPTVPASEPFPLHHTEAEVLPITDENCTTPLQPNHSRKHTVSQIQFPAHSHYHRSSRIPIPHHLGNNQQNSYPVHSTPLNMLDDRYAPLIQADADIPQFSTSPPEDGFMSQSSQPIHPLPQGKQYSAVNTHQPATQNSPASPSTHLVFTKPTKQTQHRSPQLRFASTPEQYNPNDQSRLPLDSYNQQNKIPTQSGFNTPQTTSPGAQNHLNDISSSIPSHNGYNTPHSRSQNYQQPAQIDSHFLQNQHTAGTIQSSTFNGQNFLTSHDSQSSEDLSPTHDDLMPPQTNCPSYYTHSTANDDYTTLRNHSFTQQSVTRSHVPLEHQQQENGPLHDQPAVQYPIPPHDQTMPAQANTQFLTSLPHTMQQTDHQSLPNPTTNDHQDHHFAHNNHPYFSSNPYHRHHAASFPQTHSSPVCYSDPNSQNRKFPPGATKRSYNHSPLVDSAPPSQHARASLTVSPNNHFTPTHNNTQSKDQHSNPTFHLPHVKHRLTPNYSSPELTKTAPPPIHHAKETQTAPSSYYHHPSSPYSALPYTTLQNSSPQLKTRSNHKPLNSRQRRQLIEHDNSTRESYSESYNTDDSSLYATSQRLKSTHKHKETYTAPDNSEERGYSDGYTDSATDSSVTITQHRTKTANSLHQQKHPTQNDAYRDRSSFHKNRKRAVQTVTQPILLHIRPKVVIKEAKPVRATVVYDTVSESDQCMVYRNQVVVKPSHVPTRVRATDSRYYRRHARVRGLQCVEEIERNNVQIDEDEETASLTEAQELADRLKRRSEQMNRKLVHNLALL